MNLLPPFIRKFGMIPESYKIAMTYEEQLLWLCKHLEDLDTSVSEFSQSLQILTDTVDSLEDRVDRNVESILELQADVNNMENVIPITLLSPNLVLDSATVELEEGYYFTGNCQVVSSNELPNTVYIDTNTYFYFNPTGGSGFTPIFKVFSDKDNLSAIGYTVEYVSSEWQKIEFNVTNSISGSSTNTQLPTATAVKNYVDGHVTPSVVKTLTEDFTLNAGIYEPYEGVYYTGYYEIKYINNNPLIPTDYITLVPENTLCTLDYATQTITILDYPDLPNVIKRTYTYDSSSQEANKWFLSQLSKVTSFDNTSGDSEIPTAKAVYNYIEAHKGEDNFYTTISETISLNDNNFYPSLSSGYYYCDNCTVIYTDSQNNIATLVQSGEIFYYDQYGFTFKVYNSTSPNRLMVKVEISNSVWVRQGINLVTSFDNTSTDNQIPSAKAVYDTYVNNVAGNGNVSAPITTIWTGSQTDYNNLQSYSNTTLYFIEE